MNQSGWIWRMALTALTALMALAVVLVWSPVGSEAAPTHVHAAGLASDAHHQHAGENDHQRGLRVTLDADCMAIGCCAETHCHPGISVDPHAMIAVAANDEITAAAAVQRSGSDPGVNLPPPRRLSL